MSALLAGVALGCALGLPAAVRGTLDFSDRSEVRVRDSGLPTDPALDVMTEPGFRLGLAGRRTKWELGYSVRYTLMNVGLSVTPTLLNTAHAQAQWLASRQTKLTLAQEGSWGTQSFIGMTSIPTAPVAVTPGTTAPAAGTTAAPGVTAVPTVASMKYVSWQPSLQSTTTLSARWLLDMTMLYSVDGGYGNDAQAILPLKWGPAFRTRAEYELSRRDKLFSRVTGERAIFSSGPEAILTEASEGIEHRLTRRTVGELEVGVAAAWSKPATNTRNDFTPFPTAAAVVSHREVIDRTSDVKLDASLHMAPSIHRLLGYVAQQLQANAGVSAAVNQVTVRLDGGAAQTLPRDDPRSLRLFFANATLSYAISRFAVVDTGVRNVWVNQVGFGLLPPQRVIYIGLTLKEPTIKF